MFDTPPRRFGFDVEEEWLRSTSIDEFFDGMTAEPALNLVGATAPAMRIQLLKRHPSRRIRAVNISDRGVPGSGPDDVLEVDAENLAASLLPRSRTIILDPQIGTWIANQQSLLGDIAMRTLESLIMPVFVEPEPYHLFFSDVFSFEESASDEALADRWCWAVGEGRASVFVQSSKPIAGRRLAFTLSSHNPGNFVCRLGDEVKHFATSPDNLTQRVEFRAPADEKIGRIDITFDGPAFHPTGALDQRKALRFCFSGFELERLEMDQATIDAVTPPRPFSFVPERVLRRRLHLNGFFEVQTLNSPWNAWANQAGIRSCFDYQAGFAFRDVWEEAGSRITTVTTKSYVVPAVWIEARRMPSPGSEWISSDERLFALHSDGRRRA